MSFFFFANGLVPFHTPLMNQTVCFPPWFFLHVPNIHHICVWLSTSQYLIFFLSLIFTIYFKYFTIYEIEGRCKINLKWTWNDEKNGTLEHYLELKNCNDTTHQANLYILYRWHILKSLTLFLSTCKLSMSYMNSYRNPLYVYIAVEK